MTHPIFYHDASVREFEASVSGAIESAVALDQTAFFPGGGGQPCDVGKLTIGDRDVAVLEVKRSDGNIWHKLDQNAPPVGTRVIGSLDWDHRHQLMRTHTALHILCGVIWRDFGAHVTGSNMTPLAARMDFELERMSSDFAEKIEERANAEIRARRRISVRFLPRFEASKLPDLIRTKINLLPEEITEVRIVDIEGLDVQADGGTHVASTLEVGYIRVVGHESKGRINKRLRIAVEDA